MIAIGSNIGTGLFIGMGAALKTGGPAALVIAFSLISIVLYLMMSSLAGKHEIHFTTKRWALFGIC